MITQKILKVMKTIQRSFRIHFFKYYFTCIGSNIRNSLDWFHTLSFINPHVAFWNPARNNPPGFQF